MNVKIDKDARKFIDKQPPKNQIRMLQAIFALPKGDICPLAGKDGIYRLRVGGYRITFCYDDESTILIRTAGNRGDVYK
ncbi:MAG: type II toxin-antitoxin system RelE/ParE family toxin [Oscillospiraceae bacterium]|nr:type II toxin-antitoxin system RelE/ParE family toxin [Oscillospiraceae bacterium]